MEFQINQKEGDKVCPFLPPIDKPIARQKTGLLKQGEPPVEIGLERQWLSCIGSHCRFWAGDGCLFDEMARNIKDLME